MAVAEDAATVLEQFVQDVANLPAEIAHLLEEIEAKDKVTTDCRIAISQRDSSIQKFAKANGASAVNPKEEAYTKAIAANYDRAQTIQDEKCALAEKSRILLDRQIKRLDLQIRSLENSGILAPDPLLPSILHNSPGNRLPPLSTTTTGASTPLAPVHANASSIPANPLSNSAIARLLPSSAQPTPPRHASPILNAPGSTTPTGPSPTAATLVRSMRESSLDAKKRRLNVPATSSSLRQSSLGPASTPKAGLATPSGRAGSAGPRAPGGVNKKQPGKSNLAPPSVGRGGLAIATAKKLGGRRKGGRKGVAGLKASMSDTGEESAPSEADGSEGSNDRAGAEKGDVKMGGIALEEEDEDGEGDGDDRKYCTCRTVSYGNMVACDSEDCPYEWFHWSCVGMTKEPGGEWFCDECKKRMGK